MAMQLLGVALGGGQWAQSRPTHAIRRATVTGCRHHCRPLCARAGIKVALPTESASGLCFLKLYCEYILALQVGAQHCCLPAIFRLLKGKLRRRVAFLAEAESIPFVDQRSMLSA